MSKTELTASELADYIERYHSHDPKLIIAATELRRLEKAERDTYEAIKPIEDWYFLSAETGERLPFPEALKLAVEDMQADREDALDCRHQQARIEELTEAAVIFRDFGEFHHLHRASDLEQVEKANLLLTKEPTDD